MKLGTKTIMAAVAAAALSVIAGLVTQGRTLYKQGNDLTQITARSTVLEAENAPEWVANLDQHLAFVRPALIATNNQTADHPNSTLCRNAPVFTPQSQGGAHVCSDAGTRRDEKGFVWPIGHLVDCIAGHYDPSSSADKGGPRLLGFPAFT